MKKTLCFSLIFLFLFQAKAFSYRWPFSDSSGPHPINGTLGEFRTTHLHEGVDMNPKDGAKTGTDATVIYAIEGCAQATVANECKYKVSGLHT